MKSNFYTYCFIATLVFLAVFLFFFKRKNEKIYLNRCEFEKNLIFEGVVKNYSTNIDDENSTFSLNDSAKIYTIPRSAKEIHLDDYDTIKKIQGHTYIIRRHLAPGDKHIDTLNLDCAP